MASDKVTGTTRVTIPSNAHAVRDALCALFETLIPNQMPQDTRDAAQIVLAEALNNIVEHAYAQSPGEIEVTLAVTERGVTCDIVDFGLPMPNGQLPCGKLAVHTQLEDLPEGGFGWYLIRTLSQDLNYRREGARNLLSFRIESKQSAH
jgi:serine/threonine-protein kinase RsbW